MSDKSKSTDSAKTSTGVSDKAKQGSKPAGADASNATPTDLTPSPAKNESTSK